MVAAKYSYHTITTTAKLLSSCFLNCNNKKEPAVVKHGMLVLPRLSTRLSHGPLNPTLSAGAAEALVCPGIFGLSLQPGESRALGTPLGCRSRKTGKAGQRDPSWAQLYVSISRGRGFYHGLQDCDKAA